MGSEAEFGDMSELDEAARQHDQCEARTDSDLLYPIYSGPDADLPGVVHMEIEVDAGISFTVYAGAVPETPLSFVRSFVEQQSGMILNCWDTLFFEPDFTETLGSMVASTIAILEPGEVYSGVLHLTASFDPNLSATYDFVDVNDDVLPSETYSDIMQGLPLVERPHRRVQIVVEDFIRRATEVLSTDTGASFTYLRVKIQEKLGTTNFQVTNHGRPLPTTGTLREICSDTTLLNLTVSGRLTAGGSDYMCPRCGKISKVKMTFMTITDICPTCHEELYIEHQQKRQRHTTQDVDVAVANDGLEESEAIDNKLQDCMNCWKRSECDASSGICGKCMKGRSSYRKCYQCRRAGSCIFGICKICSDGDGNGVEAPQDSQSIDPGASSSSVAPVAQQLSAEVRAQIAARRQQALAIKEARAKALLAPMPAPAGINGVPVESAPAVQSVDESTAAIDQPQLSAATSNAPISAAPAPVPAMAPEDPPSSVLTLQQALHMTFYEALGVHPGASVKAIRTAFGKRSLEHHPDKGGDVELFKYLSMVRDVLCDAESRRRYDANGKAEFVGPWTASDPPGAPTSQPTPRVQVDAPPLNVEFLRKLSSYRGIYNHKWGHVRLSDAMATLASRKPRLHDLYTECELAKQAGVGLRLQGRVPDGSKGWAELPVYGMCRLIRFAAVMGQPVVELDLPASHPRQILAYAVEHGLPHDVLIQAFGDRQKIRTFRESFQPIPATTIKAITNKLCYGMGTRHLPGLPPRIMALKAEVRTVARHIFDNAPASWHVAVKSRMAAKNATAAQGERPGRPELTMLSMMCQVRERSELTTICSSLPCHVTINGYLGDSVLVRDSPDFDAGEFCSMMETRHNILVERKPLPMSEEEYAERFYDIAGVELDRHFRSYLQVFFLKLG